MTELLKHVRTPNEIPFANGFTRAEIARCISSRRLDLTLLPTEKCNFRCTYCYEDFENGRMRPEVIEGIKNLISRRAAAGLEELHIGWFGGEPLLAKPVILDICRHAKSESDRFGFNFYGSMTTNAYLLTPDVLSELVGLNQFFYQISLDGTREEHNKTRLRADGAGTFDRIWGNLRAARALPSPDFSIQLRVHLTSENFESLKGLMLLIRSEFGDDPRFRIDLQHIRDMGGAGSLNVKPLSAEKILANGRFLRALANTGLPPTNDFAPLPPSTKQTERGGKLDSAGNDICYASKPNHWLIRSTGELGRCTVMLNDDRNRLGWINRDGTMNFDSDKLMPWFEGFRDLDPDVLACPVPHLPARTSKRSVIPIKSAAVA